MTITRIRLKKFTAFEDLDLTVNPGINVFIGENATGKTHLMKVAYAACDITKTEMNFGEKLIRVFLPSGRAIGRLVKRQQGSSRGSAQVWKGEDDIRISFSNHSQKASSATVKGAKAWKDQAVESVFIPVKEMLSNAPGFRSLYTQREIHFEEIYADIIDRAYRPALRGPMDKNRKRILETLRQAIDGKITIKNEEFFLRNKRGNLEFTLVAEGMRKLGLLWLLLQNGTLLNGSVLFWDEPETNLNPKLFSVLMGILLELQRLGVQVFVATHDYAILKELELAARSDDHLAFYTLYRHSESGEVVCESAEQPFLLEHSPIAEAMSSLYDREVERTLGGDDD